MAEAAERFPRIPLPEMGSLEEVARDFDLLLGFREGTIISLIAGLARMDHWSEFRFDKKGYYIRGRLEKWQGVIRVEVGGPHGSRVFELKPRWSTEEAPSGDSPE